MYHHIKYKSIALFVKTMQWIDIQCSSLHRSRYMKQLLVDIEVDICVHRCRYMKQLLVVDISVDIYCDI